MMVDNAATQLKPFRLVKFFTFSGLAVVLIFALVLSWFISKHTKRVLLERREAYAQVFAENLNHQVFQQFVIPTVLRYGRIALRNPEQFQLLDTIVRNVTHGMNIESVTIFDSRENVTSYSTVPERIGRRDEGGVEYEKALKGQNNSVLCSTGSLRNLLPGLAPITCQLRTYIPFRQKKPLGKDTDVIMGVIEIAQDLSEELDEIIRLQGIIVVASVGIMSALFVILRLIVARADRIIEARAEERRKLEERLYESERLANLGRMVASVSHELKNPLGIVGSTAELLRKRLEAVAPGNGHLAKIIVDETSRLDGVVREFLDFARPHTPNKKAVSVNKMLVAAADFMQAELKKRGVVLESHLDETLPLLMADWDLIYRAFLNVMINAVQAMPEGGKLILTTRRPAGGAPGAVIEIQDTGVGVGENEREQLFTPFFTTKNRGTGLGLAIVKNIVDNHGGTIAVESEPGQGALFRIIL